MIKITNIEKIEASLQASWRDVLLTANCLTFKCPSSTSKGTKRAERRKMKEIAARVPLRYFKGHLSGSKTLHQQAKESKRATNNKEGHIKE